MTALRFIFSLILLTASTELDGAQRPIVDEAMDQKHKRGSSLSTTPGWPTPEGTSPALPLNVVTANYPRIFKLDVDVLPLSGNESSDDSADELAQASCLNVALGILRMVSMPNVLDSSSFAGLIELMSKFHADLSDNVAGSIEWKLAAIINNLKSDYQTVRGYKADIMSVLVLYIQKYYLNSIKKDLLETLLQHHDFSTQSITVILSIGCKKKYPKPAPMKSRSLVRFSSEDELDPISGDARQLIEAAIDKAAAARYF